MSVERIFFTPPSLPVSESISVGRTRWNTNQCTYIDRVPVSVSEWLLGSFVLILTVFVQLNQYSKILRRQCCLYIRSHLLRNPQASQLGKPDYSVLTQPCPPNCNALHPKQNIENRPANIVCLICEGQVSANLGVRRVCSHLYFDLHHSIPNCALYPHILI